MVRVWHLRMLGGPLGLMWLGIVSTCWLGGCTRADPPLKTVTDDTRTRLAEALLAKGDTVNAEEALRTPESRAVSSASDTLKHAAVLISVGQTDRGMRLADAALAAHPDDPDVTLGAARLALRANRPEQALKAYHSVLRLRGDDETALNGVGVAQAQQGDLKAAEATLRRTTGLYPRSADAHANLVLVLLLQGQVPAATSAYAELERAAPSFQTNGLRELLRLETAQAHTIAKR